MAIGTGTAISLALTAIGTGVSVYSQNQAADQARAAGEYNARVAENQAAYNARVAQAQAAYNAQIAEKQAAYTSNIFAQDANNKELEARENNRRQREDKRRKMAQAKSRLAASGAGIGEGTAVDILTALDTRLETEIQDTARAAFLDVRALREEAKLAKYQGAQQAGTIRYEGADRSRLTLYEGSNRAGVSRYGGNQDAATLKLQSYGTLLDGAATTSTRYSDARYRRTRRA